jgi:uncharacterized protein
MKGASAFRLSDGRLHLQHGPIDLICECFGSKYLVEAAYQRATARFQSVLDELVSELAALRCEHLAVYGQIAVLMMQAVLPFRPSFITPMAAVAGAVADTVLAAMVGPGILRAYVNNGGDIALHITTGEQLVCAVAGTKSTIALRSTDMARGIATSGWRGRSWSLGIADSVSVLAKTAAKADSAATMIANAVDLPDHPLITRRPACALQSDTDLGARLVTVGVGKLSLTDVGSALSRGEAAATCYRAAGLIESAALFLQGESRIVGNIALKEPAFA